MLNSKTNTKRKLSFQEEKIRVKKIKCEEHQEKENELLIYLPKVLTRLVLEYSKKWIRWKIGKNAQIQTRKISHSLLAYINEAGLAIQMTPLPENRFFLSFVSDDLNSGMQTQIWHYTTTKKECTLEQVTSFSIPTEYDDLWLFHEPQYLLQLSSTKIIFYNLRDNEPLKTSRIEDKPNFLQNDLTSSLAVINNHLFAFQKKKKNCTFYGYDLNEKKLIHQFEYMGQSFCVSTNISYVCIQTCLTLDVFDLNDFKKALVVDVSTKPFTSFSFLSDYELLLFSCRGMEMWNMQSKQQVWSRSAYENMDREIYCFTSDLFLSTGEEDCKIIHKGNGKTVQKVDIPDDDYFFIDNKEVNQEIRIGVMKKSKKNQACCFCLLTSQ